MTQPAITCSKLTIETVEQGVKYVQSLRARSVVVSDLRSEPKGSRFEPGC